MSDIDTRIAQFENMTSADPENEMAHFSLGNAYIEAKRYPDAAERFQRVIELNPQMSKAYQLGGLALTECGRNDDAGKMLAEGFLLAASRGDLMVRDSIAEQLQAIGHEVPEITTEVEAAAKAASEGGGFTCSRTGKSGTQLQDPPFRGPVGEWVQQHISAETWREWIGQGTKVINELRLDFSRDEDQEVFDREMREYLGIDDELHRQLTSPTSTDS
ncbi:MAG: Fe(2+)-trafficking protein [Phycisphaerales bacterium]|nr:Fe(2+)-trafficking protein [Phycisphaerales bacterium]